MLCIYTVTTCILSSLLVGISGIVPLLFISFDAKGSQFSTARKRTLNRWLSYAVGSLLGDVFFHLIPETLQSHSGDSDHRLPVWGVWIIIGVVVFFSIEKISLVQAHSNKGKTKKSTKKQHSSGGTNTSKTDSSIHVEGYLNLVANVIDNFTHGVAIGGSYLLSPRIGLLNTLCILVHEIPHEMSDFVILLRNGFNRWQAAKAQLITASSCTFGALATLIVDATITDWSNRWILPFTSGGFLYIALVTLTPDLQKETCRRECFVQLGLIACGLLSMGLLSVWLD